MAAKIFRINYKSDFILTLNSDAGWMTPFCIKFWTGAPAQAFFAGWDGETYTNCSYDPSEPNKLVVQFNDHHLPIGDLKFQIAYHFTAADFPNDTEDEVINQANITVDIDGQEYQVMLDFNGETAPEIQFSLPAYANEAQRIANEETRIENEAQRIQNEETRINQEQTRQDNEAQRIRNEQTRISQEEARVREFATLKRESEAATTAANDAAALANAKAALANDKAQLAADKAALAQDAAALANQKAQLAADKAALANDAAALANEKAVLAQQKAEYAKDQGDYAKQQGVYAKEQGDYAKQKGDDAAAQMQQQAQDFNEAQTARQTAYEQAEGTESGSVAGDGSRWGAFKTNEAARDALVDAKVADITNLQKAVVEGAVYDISANHLTEGVPTKYANLSAALGVDGANVPVDKRKGGMSVKFVQSSDNKYVQYFLNAQTFTTYVSAWEKMNLEEEVSQLEQEVLPLSEMKNSGHSDSNTFAITSSDPSRRKDYAIPIESGKTYKVRLTSTNATLDGSSSSGLYLYSNNDTAGANTQSAWMKELNKFYEFTCVNSGVLRFYCLSGSDGDTINAAFEIYFSDALYFTKLDKDVYESEVVKHTAQQLTDAQKTQARTNIGAASEEYVEENVLPLEHEMEPVSDELTKESYDAEHTLEGYLYTGGSRYVYDEYYYTCYFIADKAGQFYVENKGLGYFNLVIGQGTLENFQNATKWANGDTMPSAESPATVNIGDLVALSFVKEVGGVQNDFQVVFSYEVERKYIPNENIKEYNEVLDFVHSGGHPLITIKKISNDEIHLCVPTKDGKNYLIHPIIHGKYSHDMTQYGGASDVLCGDNYDPGIITDKDGNPLIQGNLNFIFLIDSNVQGFENEDYHVGTVIDHGLEVREYTKLFADGIEFTIADMTEDIVCSTFRMIQKSKCYAADSSINTGNSHNYPKLNNGEPVVAAMHFVDAKYEVGNIITWRNALEVKRNGTVFSQLHGGMVRSFTNKLHEVVVNDEKFSMNHFAYENGQYVVEPIGDSSNLLYANRHADQADMYGDAIRIFQRMAQDDGARYDKSIMFCQKYEQQDLLSFKVYFMPALVTLRSSIQDAEVFNDGDIISVTNRREIDI